MKNKIIVLVIMILLCTGCYGYMNEQKVTCTIKDKWIKRYDEQDIYMVSCDDEVYKIEDLFFKGKFNSSNIYANLEKGKEYKLTVTGYRMPYLSEYQNINNYEEVAENGKE